MNTQPLNDDFYQVYCALIRERAEVECHVIEGQHLTAEFLSEGNERAFRKVARKLNDNRKTLSSLRIACSLFAKDARTGFSSPNVQRIVAAIVSRTGAEVSA
jgi:hypothetical protein